MSNSSDARGAPGWPGSPPTWTSSSKIGVGTALGPASRVWFTLSHGILNEVFYPRPDVACTRDLGLVVTDGKEFFSEEKRHADHQVSYLAEGVPAFRIVNSCHQGRYTIEKEILADPRRDGVLQKTRFTARQGTLADYHLHVLLAPHLGNRGSNNTAWVGDYKGVPMLMARGNGLALALACSAPWGIRSAGYVGRSDGWQDLVRHRRLTWEYPKAENGNVALVGEVELGADAEFVLALTFGRSWSEAAQRARAGLVEGFARAHGQYVGEWQAWQKSLYPLDEQHPVSGARTSRSTDFSHQQNLYRSSTLVMRVHEAKDVTGGGIASLSVPWGFSKGDDDLGGYHLVWARDLVEVVGGLTAAGAHGDAHRVLRFLSTTQEADGHWPQNMWLDGLPYWDGLQLDEVAFPVLLIDMARRQRSIGDEDIRLLWPMARKALQFVITHGPASDQDRWEENAGYSPFTLAVEISALLAGADLAEENGEPQIAAYLRETADLWNASIERWVHVTGTELARRVGVDGYYIRLASPQTGGSSSPAGGVIPIKNRPDGPDPRPAEDVVSPDALALVRFGLRAPDDPRILDTVKVIDATLRVETPSGPSWHRYTGDGYGEHADGSPYDGSGIGRVWPLLVGERAHYELAAGHRDEAERLLRAIAAFANPGGMLPEQTWDAPDIPERELFCGRPSDSAMPLVWAHAEYVKLLRSLRDGKIYDTPPQTEQRYLRDKTGTPYALWRFSHQIQRLPVGKGLRVEVMAPATVRWSADGWKSANETRTRDSGLGVHVADLPTERLRDGDRVVLTFRWRDRWEERDFSVEVRD